MPGTEPGAESMFICAKTKRERGRNLKAWKRKVKENRERRKRENKRKEKG